MVKRIILSSAILILIGLLSSFYSEGKKYNTLNTSVTEEGPDYINFKEGVSEKTSRPENSVQKSQGFKAVEISWNQLRDLKFRPKYNKEYRQMISYPVFGESVKKLEGKQVSISGYMIPMDVKANLYAISRFNYSSCFFCGAAGLESVISLKFIGNPRRFRVDEYCTIQGKLELNADDLDDFIYIFRDAHEIEKY